jgi:hypothetical protein
MATRSSARLAALSPPPALPPRTNNMDTKRLSVASEIWTDEKLTEFQCQVIPCSKLEDLLPPEFVPGDNGNRPGIEVTVDTINMPKQLVSENYDETNEKNDLLVQGFLDTLRVVQTMFMSLDENEHNKSIHQSEAYTRHLLYDFVRLLLLSNKGVFTKQGNGDLQIGYPLP